MALIVQKYGGTSVGSVDRIKNVARRVARYHREGHQLVVVVSAMTGETNRLLALAKELSPNPNPRELDVVAATGEQVTIGLLAIALEAMGFKAKSYTGGQVRVLTDSAFTKARILAIDEDNDARRSRRGHDRRSSPASRAWTRTATSRRSAAAARTRRASRSPRRSRPTSARSTPTSTASTRPTRASCPRRGGSTRSPSRKCSRWRASARRCCRSARSSSPASTTSSCACCRRSRIRSPRRTGTLITFEEDETMEQAIISGIAFNRDEAKISVMGVEDRPGIAYAILGPIAAANIDVDMIVQNIGASGHTDFSFTVNRSEYQKALDVLAGERGKSVQGARDHRRQPDLQGLGRRHRHALARRHREQDVQDARRRGHQHPDDLDLRDQDLGRHRREVPRARRARAAPAFELDKAPEEA